jgi:hypothetical protein
MLYTGQLNEFIRLAEIDNTNCDLQLQTVWLLLGFRRIKN